MSSIPAYLLLAWPQTASLRRHVGRW